MIPFKNLTLADRPVVERYAAAAGREDAGAFFENIWNSRHETNVRFAVVEDLLVLRYETNGRFTYSMPMGRGGLRFALMQMMEDADTMRMACGMTGLSEKDVDAVKSAMPGYFAFEQEEGCDPSAKVFKAVPLTSYTNSIYYNNEGMVPPP